MQAEPRTISFESLPKLDNHGLPPIWVDAVSLTLRHDQTGNDVGLFRCYSFLPDLAYEVARLQVSPMFLRALADLLARTTNYYPSKPEATQERARE